MNTRHAALKILQPGPWLVVLLTLITCGGLCPAAEPEADQRLQKTLETSRIPVAFDEPSAKACILRIARDAGFEVVIPEAAAGLDEPVWWHGHGTVSIGEALDTLLARSPFVHRVKGGKVILLEVKAADAKFKPVGPDQPQVVLVAKHVSRRRVDYSGIEGMWLEFEVKEVVRLALEKPAEGASSDHILLKKRCADLAKHRALLWKIEHLGEKEVKDLISRLTARLEAGKDCILAFKSSSVLLVSPLSEPTEFATINSCLDGVILNKAPKVLADIDKAFAEAYRPLRIPTPADGPPPGPPADGPPPGAPPAAAADEKKPTAGSERAAHADGVGNEAAARSVR